MQLGKREDWMKYRKEYKSEKCRKYERIVSKAKTKVPKIKR